MRFYVNLSGMRNVTAIERLRSRLGDTAALHEKIGDGVEKAVRGHVRELGSRSPNTNFYGKAADSVASSSDARAALVRVAHRGFRLRYHGGRVEPVREGIKNLALPTEHVPVRGFVRLAPRDAGTLAWIPRLGGPSVTTGFLVEGVQKTITRGKNKGKKRTVPKKDGKLMYVLRAWTDHEADTSVIPTDDELGNAAGAAALDYLA